MIIRPGIRDGKRMIFAGPSTHKLGTCPQTAPYFCCICRIWTLEYEYACLPCSPEWASACLAEPMCQEYHGTLIPCPVSPCEGQVQCDPWAKAPIEWSTDPTLIPANQPANPGRIGMQVTFGGMRTALIDPAAELLADPNRSLRCAMLSSLPEQALFVGEDTDQDGVAEVEVRIIRNSPPTNWLMYAYALTRMGGERYRLMYFLGGGSTWRQIMEGDTVRLPNMATTSGRQGGILADPNGWAEISLDRTA